MNLEMEYYHVHSNYSNLFTQTDSTMFISDYAKEYRKRGNHVLCISEHGNRSNVWEQYDICQKYKQEDYTMTPLAAAEVYFTPDRKNTEGKTYHLILVAKDMEGFYQLNECLSEANISGFYKRARVDYELLGNLNTNHFLCTSACVAGILGDDYYDYHVCKMHEIFKDNFRLEIQHHPFDIQKKINTRALAMYKKYNIPLIYGTDSHYITHEDKFLRKELMLSSGITYEYEDEFDLFLPTVEEGYELLMSQNIFSRAQIEEAIENTLILRDFKGVSFDNSRKMPNCKPDMTLEQRNHLFKKLVAKGYMEQEGSMSEEEIAELKTEVDTITDTNSADYFILHKEIIDKGKEYGGRITQTSRGSAASFATNYALGFTTINRLKAPVTLYPDRFISKDRLAAGSNPD